VYESHVARVAEGSALSRVAEDAGAVVGFVSAEVRPRLNQQTPEVWISDLVVAAAHRGRGVGKALLGAVVADARRIGAHGVCLESGRWRKDAHRFYAREGMADVGSHFVLKLR
jgi:GNAT superfamily N-acetyltransferase